MSKGMISFFNKNGSAMVKNSQAAHKKLLRERCREISAALDDAYIYGASLRIADRVINLPEFREARTVFCYMNMPGEAGTEAILHAAFESGKRVCIPLCMDAADDGEAIEKVHLMEAREYRPGDGLVLGAYGIREPGPGSRTVAPEDIDIAIIPCVAADRFGNRLGHGAGYYDRFMRGAGFTKCCLCFDRLIMGSVPITEFDIPMDMVITEREIHRRDSGTVHVKHSGAR